MSRYASITEKLILSSSHGYCCRHVPRLMWWQSCSAKSRTEKHSRRVGTGPSTTTDVLSLNGIPMFPEEPLGSTDMQKKSGRGFRGDHHTTVHPTGGSTTTGSSIEETSISKKPTSETCSLPSAACIFLPPLSIPTQTSILVRTVPTLTAPMV